MRIHLAFIGIFYAWSAIVGCTEGTKQKSLLVNTDATAYAEASCLYKFDEGPKALPAGSTDVREVYFHKNLDFGLLKPVLGSSAAELVNFAENTGVRFHSTSAYIATGCTFASPLPAASSALTTTFNESGDKTIGLYLSRFHRDSDGQRANIVVRLDSNKWVLTHEYAHHLFSLQRETEPKSPLPSPISTNSIFDQLKAADTQFSLATEASKPVLARDALVKIKMWNESTLRGLKNTALEEITVESLLTEKFDAAELALVHSGQKMNAAGHIIVASSNAMSALSKMKEINAIAQNKYAVYITVKEASELKDLNAPLQEASAEIARLSSKANQVLAAAGATLNRDNGLITETPITSYSTAHVGCDLDVQGSVLEDKIAKLRQWMTRPKRQKN